MNPVRTLLVDDNSTLLQIITHFLQQYDDIAVVGTLSGDQESLAQVQSLRPQVVVIDLGTPGLTRLETIAHLRAMMPEVGIIAISLLSASGYRQVALAAGADDFVSKRNLSTDLVPAIRRVAQTVRSAEELTDGVGVPVIDEGDQESFSTK